MIRQTNVTSRDVSVNEIEVVAGLRELNPGWYYHGIVGDMKVFKLVVTD